MKSTHSIHRHKSLSHELRSEGVSGASKRANGGANGPVLYTSISYDFYPQCMGRSALDAALAISSVGMAHALSIFSNRQLGIGDINKQMLFLVKTLDDSVYRTCKLRSEPMSEQAGDESEGHVMFRYCSLYLLTSHFLIFIINFALFRCYKAPL